MQLKRLIEWGDCDAAGIVFYPNYFRWMDGAYHQFTRSVGYDQSSLLRDHGVFATPLIESTCKFVAPARFYQEIETHTVVERIGNTSLVLSYRFEMAGRLVAEGRETRGFVTKTGDDIVKTSIPVLIRANLEMHLA